VLAAHPNPAQFLRVDTTNRSALVILVASYDGSNNGFNFDGYGRGELLVTVPRGWRVRVRCANRGTIGHSCAVVRGPMTVTPAFRGAATPILPRGATATFSFVASRTGSYRFACLVPGHEEARMYDVLEVTRGGKPAITARSGP
jgi:sulfocyanin SoxE-like protein